MVERDKDKLPSSKTLTRHCKDLGAEIWHQYKQLREVYKSKGLTPKEAYERAAKELRIMERWRDWHERKQFRELSGSDVPMTPEELKKVLPNYVPPSETRAEEVGDDIISPREAVLWARDQRALVENGAEAPKRFPNTAALSWYQYALSNREKFMTHVANQEKQVEGGDSIYMQDGEFHFKELESQIREALGEVGSELAAMLEERKEELRAEGKTEEEIEEMFGG